MKVRTGLDRLVAGEVDLKGQRVGLLAHPASVDSNLRHAVDILRERFDLKVVFGPEHGFAGTAQDMIGVDGESAGDLRVVSLYGETAADLQPNKADLEDLDVVVVDLQDVGARYYTYVWTCAFMLRIASKVGVRTLVLDRPNPLGGMVVEGMPQRAGYRSFVGLYDVAVRHGMTIGEIAQHVRRHEGIDENALDVVTMEGWSRDMFFDQTGLPWVLPSPNMPTLDTAIVYPGGCVIEGTRLSEGRGQTRPFEIWGAPSVDGSTLSAVEGATLRPLTFQPTFQKHAGALCGGVQVHVTDRNAFRSYQAYLRWIAEMLTQLDLEMPWRTEEYEYETLRPAIDLLTGGPEYRQLVNRRDALDEYFAQDAAGAAEFQVARQLLY